MQPYVPSQELQQWQRKRDEWHLQFMRDHEQWLKDAEEIRARLTVIETYLDQEQL